MTNIHLIWYLVPLLPLFVRLLIAVRFSGYMQDLLSEESSDRDAHRTLFSALAAISFAGLLAVVALPGDVRDRHLQIWYMLCSFVLLLGALNLQGYKATRWQDWLGDGLLEAAMLSLLAAIAAYIFWSPLEFWFRVSCLALAVLGWVADFMLRLWFSIQHLRAKEERDGLT